MFAIPDPQYWDFCYELASNQAMIDQIKSKEAIDIMGNLKDLDILKDELVLKYCEKLSNEIDEMSVEQVTDFLTIFNCEESKFAHQQAKKTNEMKNEINKVVQRLLMLGDSFNESNYGKLIHAFDDDNDYAAFLDKTSKFVREMTKNGSISMNDAPHIMRAYHNDKDKITGGY